MRVAVAAAILVAVVALGACGGGSGTMRTNPRPTTTSTSTAPTTSTPPSTPPITIALICSSPTDAAHAFVQAWLAEDRGAAGRCATPDAVATLFARSGHGAGWTFQQCGGPDPGVPICTYAYSGGTATLTLMGTEAQGWKVSAVQLA